VKNNLEEDETNKNNLEGEKNNVEEMAAEDSKSSNA